MNNEIMERGDEVNKYEENLLLVDRNNIICGNFLEIWIKRCILG